MMTPNKTSEYILIATITAIEKYGVQHVTTRRIADEAGVNNAALHYYYGTKENLVAQALELTLQHMMDDTDTILSTNEDYPERLKTLFLYLCEGVLRFPNLIRAHLDGPLMEGDANSPFLDMLDAWLTRTSAEFEATLSDEVHQRLRMAFQAAISSLLIAGLLPAKTGVNTAIDLRDENARDVLIQLLVNTIVHQLE